MDEQMKNEMVKLAEDILNDNIDLIAGCRKICALARSTSLYNDRLIIPFRGADSETDDYPIGKVREFCATSYLEEMDKKKEEYLAEEGSNIREWCVNLICYLKSL
ncbi:MAG: hypothetical protein LLG04_00530 [Parachlamydia sp.]|nr:hypothetical protein [Parachlamydia sp.]